MPVGGPRYVQLPPEPLDAPPTVTSPVTPLRQGVPEPNRIFDELPRATIVSVSRPDAGDISPMLLSYTIEFQYKQVPTLHYLFPLFSYLVLFSCSSIFSHHISSDPYDETSYVTKKARERQERKIGRILESNVFQYIISVYTNIGNSPQVYFNRINE